MNFFVTNPQGLEIALTEDNLWDIYMGDALREGGLHDLFTFPFHEDLYRRIAEQIEEAHRLIFQGVNQPDAIDELAFP